MALWRGLLDLRPFEGNSEIRFSFHHKQRRGLGNTCQTWSFLWNPFWSLKPQDLQCGCGKWCRCKKGISRIGCHKMPSSCMLHCLKWKQGHHNLCSTHAQFHNCLRPSSVVVSFKNCESSKYATKLPLGASSPKRLVHTVFFHHAACLQLITSSKN